MARVFLTGASGFLGRQVHTALTQAGHEVTGLTRAAPATSHGVRGDLTDAATYRKALAATDCVVHLAAATGRAGPEEFARVNVEGTRTLLAAAAEAGVRRTLFCSSIAVTFADLAGYPYAQTKVEGERLVASSGLRTVIVRPTIIGGAGSPVLDKLAALARLPVIPLFGGGRSRVEPVHVTDVARVIAGLVNEDMFSGDVVELGGPSTVTLRELLERLRRRTHTSPARFLSIPVGPLLPVLALGERLAGPAWPLPVGQLATFRFDGVAKSHPIVERARETMVPLDQIVTEVRGS